MKRAHLLHAALAAILALSGATLAKADQGNGNGNNNNNNNETRLKTRLAGAAIQGRAPEGNAEFRFDARGRTRLKVEVENVNLPAGTMLGVAIHHGGVSQAVGRITLSAPGFGELELESEDGDMVPAVQKGDMVTVSHAGVIILAGVF